MKQKIIITVWGDYEDTQVLVGKDYARGFCACLAEADKAGYAGWLWPDEADDMLAEYPELYAEVMRLERDV